MRKPPTREVLEALKNSLRDLERVRMTAPENPELLDLKRQIQKMIKQAEQTIADYAKKSA
jgi:hypothetical protein